MASTATALVLLSGGIDSTTCVAHYKAMGMDTSAVFIDFGQVAAVKESAASTAVSQAYGIPLIKIKYTPPLQVGAGFIQGRNAFLLHTALLHFRYASGVVALGIHAGTNYIDCSERFVDAVGQVFDVYSDGRILVAAPFLTWSKSDIWDYAKKLSVPLNLTYSCELGKDQPCGRCSSCRDLEVLYAREMF